MDAAQQLPANGAAKGLKSVSHAASDNYRNKAIIPYRQMGQIKYRRSDSEDAELDSKGGQVPSLSADDSSRASSITHPGNSSEADDSGGWYPQGDEHIPFLLRTSSPLPVESHFHGSPTNFGTLPPMQSCSAQKMPDISNLPPYTTNLGQEASRRSQDPKTVDSSKVLHSPLAVRESSASIQKSTLRYELSDSDGDSDDDCSPGDIDNDEWSGADDNIEAALYQAVYPDIDLAAHMVSTMYPTLLQSYRKKITRKVSSWQKHNITSCGISSGTASTTKEGAPQGTPETRRGSSSKRDRQSRSPDDNLEEDEDDDIEDSRRKRSREQPDSEFEIPKARFACHFFKSDPVKYSRRACQGPGWFTIGQLKEHFQRVHRPVQCRRCYRTFSFKHRERSAAVSELDAHYQQDEPCRRGLASLKEGINDAEWSRICEDKKKSWKSKGKDKATNINQTSNPSKQWYEIWAIICPDMEAPSTPLLHGSDEDILKELLASDQQKYSLYRSTFQAISGTTTDSFSNIGDNDLHSSGESGSWQKVTKDADAAQQSPPLLNSSHLQPEVHSSAREVRVIPVHPSLVPDATANAREVSMSEPPNNPIPDATYAGDNTQTQPRRISPQTTTAPMFTSFHSVQVGMGMGENVQDASQDPRFATPSNPNYDPNINTNTNGLTSPDAYLNNGADYTSG
ncbi:hypothetical protein ACEPPN_018712 [Leptodophora sp. 'Broadleaf-Isolate-01']